MITTHDSYLLSICPSCGTDKFNPQGRCISSCTDINGNWVAKAQIRVAPVRARGFVGSVGHIPAAVATGGYVKVTDEVAAAFHGPRRDQLRFTDNGTDAPDREDWLKEKFPWLNTSS